jgi:single-strand DNA-binding protein
MNLNKAMIIGNLTRDPEVRTTPTGQNVASFAVATNRVWNDNQGQRQEKVEFHNVVAWARLAEICGQYLRKGSKIYIEGRLQTRDWMGQDNVKRYRTEIVAENMIMLDRAGAGNSASMGGNQQNTRNTEGDQGYSSNEPTVDFEAPTNEADEEDIKVENIPF